MEIKCFNKSIDWGSLIGKSIELEDRIVIATVYDENDKSIYIGEFFSNNIGQTTKVALMDIEKAMCILKILGYDLTLVDGGYFCNETLLKTQGLIQAGFSKLIKQGDDYTVDNIFPQNFLTQEELDYLLNEGVEEILLSDIK